jgi:hypothetical protein
MPAILIVTFPTPPNAVRVRRALQTLGCGALRDSAYLHPLKNAALCEPLAAEVRETEARRRGTVVPEALYAAPALSTGTSP